ncbi:MAG TPA: peptidoglycan DD-metalloendopeptidase family protein [Candidatus Paceibacterota bacterium]
MRKASIFLIFFILGSGMAASQVDSSSPEALLSAINEKTKQLEDVNIQIQETQKNVDILGREANTLNKEIKRFDYNISQMNLGIKSSEIKIEKLGLELEVLENNIETVTDEINLKRTAIGEALRRVQQNDGQSLIEILLKNRSLVEAVLEVQSLKDLQVGLSSSVIQLGLSRSELDEVLQETAIKKVDVETENKNLKNRKSILDEQKNEKNQLLKEVKNKESIYQEQITLLEKQQRALSEEIDKIEDDLRVRFDRALIPSPRPGVLSWPIKLVNDGGIGRITQHAGEVSYLYGGRAHNGLDIGVPLGTPVFAAADGVVAAVDNNDVSSYRKYQYGKYVLIKHDNNLATLYAHLSKQVVSAESAVKRGELIGYSGNTGYSTGPHLHFGLYGSPSSIISCPANISIPMLCMGKRPPAAGLVPIGPYLDPEQYL